MIRKLFIVPALMTLAAAIGSSQSKTDAVETPVLTGVSLGETFAQFQAQEFTTNQQRSLVAACNAGTDTSDRCKNYLAVKRDGGILGCVAGDTVNALCESFTGLIRFTDGKVSKVGWVLSSSVDFKTLVANATKQYGVPTTSGESKVVWEKDGYSYTLEQNTDNTLETHNVLILAADGAPSSKATTLTGVSAPTTITPTPAPSSDSADGKPHSVYQVQGISLSENVGDSSYTGQLQCGHRYVIPSPNKAVQKAFCKSHRAFEGILDVYHGEVQTITYVNGGSDTDQLESEFAKVRAQAGQSLGVPTEESLLSAKWIAADGSFLHLYAVAASPMNGWWDFQTFVAAPNSRRSENGFQLTTAGN